MSDEKYTVYLNSEQNEQEYEKNDKNFIQVEIQSKGKITSNQDDIVYLTMSEDAMLALGTELIRAAKGDRKKDIWEMHPSKKGHAVINMGVYLHPKSTQLKVFRKDRGDFESILNSESEN